MKKYFNLILCLMIAVMFLSGCVVDLVIPEDDSNPIVSGNDPNSPNQVNEGISGKGTLKIYLTDAPGDYKEVNIVLSSIEGHIAGDDEVEGYWQELKEWPGGMQVDLIKLEDVSILLASLQLEPNKYTQLRLFLKEGEDNAWLILNDEKSTQVFFEIPSSVNTGIKLNHPFEIVAGMITKLTIDFDADKSIIKTGNGKYKMKPVIGVESEIYSAGELLIGTGSVSGTVSYYNSESLELVMVGGATVSLTGGAYIFTNTTVTLEEVGSEGTFNLSNVPAGNYTLNVFADTFNNYSESILVNSGLNTEVNVILLDKEPGAISGSVTDSASEAPIGGASVSVTLTGGSWNFTTSVLTDGGGLFFIDQLPVGLYDIKVMAEGYEEYNESGIAVAEGSETSGLIIELIPTSSL